MPVPPSRGSNKLMACNNAGTNIVGKTIAVTGGIDVAHTDSTITLSIPQLNTGYLQEWIIQPKSDNTNAFDLIGFPTSPTTNGTFTSVRDSGGRWMSYASSTTVDTVGGLTNSSFTPIERQIGSDLRVTIKTGPNSTDVQNCRNLDRSLFSRSYSI